MTDWCINSIEQKKRGHMDIYNQTLIDIFGKQITWKEVKKLERHDQLKLLFELGNNIKTDESKLDIRKLARAIQNSRSGAGGCAITNFECTFCGNIESWSNTNTPGICHDCAEEMARNIVIMGSNIFK